MTDSDSGEESSDLSEDVVEIRATVNKRSRKLRQKVIFDNMRAVMNAEIMPDLALQAEYITSYPLHKTCQVSNCWSENEVNTAQVSYGVTGMNHVEGGWPKEVDLEETDQVRRYIKKIEKDDKYLKQVLGLSKLAEDKVKQNNAVEIFEEYFEFNDEPTNLKLNAANTVMVYPDPTRGKGDMRRPVSDISWCPDGGSKIAISYCSPEFQGIQPGTPTQGYVFDVTNPINHVTKLGCPSHLTSIQYNPKVESQVAGGCHNGQLCWWDIKAGWEPQGIISLEESHKEPIYSIIWVSSKTDSEIMTASTDGTVCWWDRRFFTKPKDIFIIDIENKNNKSSGDINRALSASILEYESTIPSRYMIGTQEGKVVCCSRKAKIQSEAIINVYKGHYGPIRGLQRNPAFTKNFLTVGDWSAKVWADDISDSSIFWVNSGTEKLTAGCWSPTKPSLFFLSRMDGFVEVNIFYKHKICNYRRAGTCSTSRMVL